MSDISNLENLSNAELRAKCIELGLPNIPVTETSRNVIIKRLRTTLVGGVSSPAGKKNTRRETIAAVTERSSPAKSLLVNAEKIGDSNRTDKRRTIAIAAADEAPAASKLPERRISKNVEKEQRRSVRASPVPKYTVVLDSDEEDEVVAAVQKVEQQQQQPLVTTRRSTSRQPSLTRTTTTVTEHKFLSAVAEESPSSLEKIHAKEVETAKLLKQEQQQQRRQQLLLKQQEEEKERLKNQERIQKQLENARLRYNAANRKPIQLQYGQKVPQLETNTAGNVAAAGRYSNISSPVYQTKTSLYPQLDIIEPTYSRTLHTSTYNEFSDDTDTDVSKQVGVDSDDEKISTPFLSEFARNLNRLKAEPLSGGDLTRRFARSRTAHEVKGRVAMSRYGREHEQGTLWENLVDLNNRFHLLRHIFLVSVVVLVVYIFFKFWQ